MQRLLKKTLQLVWQQALAEPDCCTRLGVHLELPDTHTIIFANFFSMMRKELFAIAKQDSSHDYLEASLSQYMFSKLGKVTVVTAFIIERLL